MHSFLFAPPFRYYLNVQKLGTGTTPHLHEPLLFSGRTGSYSLSTRHYTLRAFHGLLNLLRRGTGPPHSLMQIRHTENIQLTYDPSPTWIRAQGPSIRTAESSIRLTAQCQCGHINPLNMKRKLLYLTLKSLN